MSEKSAEKLRVNVVSESGSVPGQGVDTAFQEMVAALKTRDDVEVFVNAKAPADITHVHTFGWLGVRAILSGRARGKKVVTVHVVPASLVGSIKGMKTLRPLVRAYLRFFYGRADLVLAISREVEDALVHELKISPEKIRLIYNAVDMKKYKTSALERKQAREKFGYKKGDFLVLGIGQTQPRKRVDSFVSVAKICPDMKFVWLGGIPFKALGADTLAIKKMIQNAPENAEFPGIVLHEKVREYLAAADAFFLPSEQENHPMCVLEAAGAGLPIVLRDIREYDDTFAGDAKMGKTDEDFAKILRELRNPRAYKTAKSGAARIAARFDNARYAEQLVALYREILRAD